MNPNDMSHGDDVLDRAGHLSELALDRFIYDPASGPPALHDRVQAHLDACAACRAALDGLREEDARAPIEVPARPTLPAPKADRAGSNVLLFRRAPVIVTTLLAAALVLFIAWPRSEPALPALDDSFRIKGTGFQFEVHVHDGTRSRPVADGDIVHPGERMAFRVAARSPGYLLILGHDDRGNSYVCYPQDGPGMAVSFVPSESPTSLQVAMAFDEILGAEHVIAYYCEQPIAFEPSSGGVPGERAGCVRRELTLKKVAPAAPGEVP